MKISIVIVNYNVKYYVEQCLLSVERALQGISGEVYVVDNNSTDGSVAYLKGRFPWVYFVQNNYNAGFSKANNQALRQARGEYLMLLNPDTIIGENVLRESIAFLDAHPDGENDIYRIDDTFSTSDHLKSGSTFMTKLSIDFIDYFEWIDAAQPTGIKTMSDVWYDLNGRKLTGRPTKKGIYIHNGKKVVIAQ